MKLHATFITYNRVELSHHALRSFLETTPKPYTLNIVDNDSTDGTREWLKEIKERYEFHGVFMLSQNYYPGYATNFGWEQSPKSATHLQRCDNDHVFLPGWCEALEEAFQNPKVGLVGLRTADEELNATTNTGGNCVIRRELWDKGLRWDERTWPQLREQLGAGITEDSLMAPAVRKMGYTWTRVQRPCIVPISSELPDSDPDWPYYLQTFRDRGIHKHLTEKTT